jgi:glutamate mutase epsilon subunit
VRSGSGQLIVNPGSVGLPALETTTPFPVQVETGSPDARYAIIQERAGGWVAELISVPYPHAAMADLARSRQRPDWACALRSGYMG